MISSSRQYCVLLLQNEAGNIKLYAKTNRLYNLLIR